MDSCLRSIECFIRQERYIPLRDYGHRICLVLVYDTHFAVIFRKLSHGKDLLGLFIPYLSTCSQMQTQYYEVLEPSAHETVGDGPVLWNESVEEAPRLAGAVQERLQVILQEEWTPGPVKNLEIWDLRSQATPDGMPAQRWLAV